MNCGPSFHQMRLLFIAGGVPLAAAVCTIDAPADWDRCRVSWTKEVNDLCRLDAQSPTFTNDLNVMVGGDSFSIGWFHFANMMTPQNSVLRFALDDESLEDKPGGTSVDYMKYSGQIIWTEIFGFIVLMFSLAWLVSSFVACCFSCCKCCRRCCGSCCCLKCCNDRHRKKPFFELRRSKLIGLTIGWSVVLVLLLYVAITSAIYGAKFAKSMDDEAASCGFAGNAYRAAYGYDGWGGLADIHTSIADQSILLDMSYPQSYYNQLRTAAGTLTAAAFDLSQTIAGPFYLSLAETLVMSQPSSLVHVPSFASTNFLILGTVGHDTCIEKPYPWDAQWDSEEIEKIKNFTNSCRTDGWTPPNFGCSEFFNLTSLQSEISSTFACMYVTAGDQTLGSEAVQSGALALSDFNNGKLSDIILEFNSLLDDLSRLLVDVRESRTIDVLDYTPWLSVGLFVVATVMILFAGIFLSLVLVCCVRGKEPKKLGHLKRSFCALWVLFCITGIPITILSSLGFAGVSLASDGCGYILEDIQQDADYSLYWPSQYVHNLFSGVNNETALQEAVAICLNPNQPDSPYAGNMFYAVGINDELVSVSDALDRLNNFVQNIFPGFWKLTSNMKIGFTQNFDLFRDAAGSMMMDWWSLSRQTSSPEIMKLYLSPALWYASLIPPVKNSSSILIDKINEMSKEVLPALLSHLADSADWPSLRPLNHSTTLIDQTFAVGFYRSTADVMAEVNSQFRVPTPAVCLVLCPTSTHVALPACETRGPNVLIDESSLELIVPTDENDFWDWDGGTFVWSQSLVTAGPDTLVLGDFLACLTGGVGGQPPLSELQTAVGLQKSLFFVNAYNALVRQITALNTSEIWKKPIVDATTSDHFDTIEEFVESQSANSKSTEGEVEKFFGIFEKIEEEQTSLMAGATASMAYMMKTANCVKITTAVIDMSDVICDHYGPFAAILFWDGILYGIAAFIAFVLGVKGWHYWRDRLRLAKSSFVSEDSTDELSIEKLLVAAILDEDLEEVTRLSGLVDVATVHVGGNATLHYAARIGNLGILEHLLEQGCNVNEENEARYTPLLIATSEFHISCVTELLEWGANPAKADEFGDTPLHIAARIGNLELVKIILTSGVDPEIQTSKSRLYADEVALQMGAVEVENYLIDAKSPQSRRARESDIGALRAVVERHQATHSREKVSAVVTSKSSK